MRRVLVEGVRGVKASPTRSADVARLEAENAQLRIELDLARGEVARLEVRVARAEADFHRLANVRASKEALLAFGCGAVPRRRIAIEWRCSMGHPHPSEAEAIACEMGGGSWRGRG